MKNKIFTIIQTLFMISFLVTAVACNDSLSVPEKETSDKPVLKIVLPQAERLVSPDSDFSTFSFELKADETTLGSYDGSYELTNDIIDLAANGISVGDEVTFTLSAVKGDISWSGTSAATTIAGGENIVTIRLFVTALGTGNGSIAYTLDYSKAPSKADVVSAHFTIRSSTDSTATPVFDKWYGLDANGSAVSDAIPSDCKIVLEKSNVPSGSYHLTAQLYAEGRQTSLVREWGETILVAAGTSTTGTKEMNVLNKAHTVTFDLNYTGSTPFVRKISYLTNLEDLNPLRNGYVFRGWYLNQECTGSVLTGEDNLFTGFTKQNAPTEDEFTLYAKWEEFAVGALSVTVFDTDTLYITSENYSITTLNGYNDSDSTKWFRIPTVSGNQYKICWVDYYTKANYDFIYNDDLGTGRFADSSITVYNADSSILTLKSMNNEEIPNPNPDYCFFIFTAESTETVVKLEAGRSDVGMNALRVTNYNPNEQVSDSLTGLIKILEDEMGVTSKYFGTQENWSSPYKAPWYWRFDITDRNAYEEVYFYLNGKPLETVPAGIICCDDYPVGIYTISIEAKKTENGQWYSYSAQLTIRESDHSQGE